MCRQPENCGRHMECACYFADKVSANDPTSPALELSSMPLAVAFLRRMKELRRNKRLSA